MTEFAAEEGAKDQLAASTPEGSATGGIKKLLLGLVIALGVAALAWRTGETLRVPEIVDSEDSPGKMPNRKQGTELSVPRATRNSAVSYAILGGLLSLAAGALSGFASGPRSFSRAGLIGGVLGATGGGATAFVLAPIYLSHLELADLTRAMLIHMGIWTSIGAAAGVAYGVGSGRRGGLLHAIIGGVVGAALAAAVFDVVGGFFPLAQTDRPLPDDATMRLVANLVVGLGVTLGIALVTSQQAPAPLAKA